MADKIEVPTVTKILSLDEARAAMEGKMPVDTGIGGMKRNADKEFVLTTALTVATGVAERVYNLMSEQQAEGLAKCEAMCLQHVEQLRAEIAGRTLAGRLRRVAAWFRSLFDGLHTPMPYMGVVDEYEGEGGVVEDAESEEAAGAACGVKEPGREAWCTRSAGHDGPHACRTKEEVPREG